MRGRDELKRLSEELRERNLPAESARDEMAQLRTDGLSAIEAMYVVSEGMGVSLTDAKAIAVEVDSALGGAALIEEYHRSPGTD